MHLKLNAILTSAGFTRHEWCLNLQTFLEFVCRSFRIEMADPKKFFIPSTTFDSHSKTLEQCFDSLDLVNPFIGKNKILLNISIQKLEQCN